MIRLTASTITERFKSNQTSSEKSSLVLQQFGRHFPPRNTSVITPNQSPFPITLKEFLIFSGVTLTAAYFLPGFAEGFIHGLNRRLVQRPPRITRPRK
jgi:hypothetical protein